MLNLGKNLIKYLIKEQPKPLGRWNIDYSRSLLKADYANMDSCGDTLCGEPDHFKNLINSNYRNDQEQNTKSKH